MAISAQLKTLLDQANVKYAVATHPVVYTAQEIAAAQHVPGRQLAKSVLVLTDHGPVLAVLPAIHLINFKKFKVLLHAKKVSIAKESDIKQQFPDVEVGAMSPFGNLYNVPVVVDKDLSESGEIVFNAGSHTDTIKIAYQAFAQLVKPKVGAFGQPFAGAKAKKKPARKRTTRRGAKTAGRGRAKGTRRRPKSAKKRR